MNTNVYENTDSETITPLNKRRILPVFLLVGLYAASTAAVMSVLPFYIREMGGSPLIIGIIIATEAFSQFCAAPLIGHLSDRVGRKRILIVTLAIAAISLLLLANAQCILFILLARTLFGISAGNLSAAAAYIADCTHVRNRRQAIGILTGCIGLGGIVGAGVSGWLSRISLSAPIYAAFILVLGSALVAIWGLKDPSTTSRTTDKIAAFSARAILKMPVLRVLIIVMLCHFFAYGMYSSQLPVFLSDTFIWNGLPFGPKALSYLLMADGVINIFVQLFLLGWVSQYFSERKLIILIFALLCTGFLTAGIATTIPVLVFAIVCISIADALAKPTYLAALSVHVSPARQGLGFNAAEMGMIFSAFFIGYALFNFIGGWASDKVGPKTVFLIAALLWSVFCGLTGLVTGLWTMLIVRVLFGMAEGPVSAAGNKIINNWISRKESATAIGIFSAGSPLGGAVSGPIVGLLALSLGWRPAFGIIFLFGLVWVLLWYFIVSDKPTMSKRLAPEERIDFENHEDVILSDDGRATPSLGYYMKQPMVWATTLAFFSYNYILFFFLTWFPSYLNHSLHLDIKEISIATVIPWVIGAIGMVLGGVCSDVIYRITGNALLSRRLILGVCLAGAAVCVAVSGTVSTIGSAITLMSVSLFLLYLTGPIYWAVIQDVVHKDKVGSVGGAMHGLANISGIIGPLVTGFIVQFSGKYDYAFYLAGAIAIVSSLLVFVFVKSKGFKANESQSCVH
ncbi:TPA_asm: MFS transporter [Salmonella enterica subsp. enterica serovar Typhimurium]|uniref:MFS transporter n=60 Tax=Gammaproteobacteria TaxID=1236 RepID=A0A717RKM0_SALTM|nr:MFS transporter [Salmonella enterica subsp. enterica serovar Typhimurium]